MIGSSNFMYKSRMISDILSVIKSGKRVLDLNIDSSQEADNCTLYFNSKLFRQWGWTGSIPLV